MLLSESWFCFFKSRFLQIVVFVLWCMHLWVGITTYCLLGWFQWYPWMAYVWHSRKWIVVRRPTQAGLPVVEEIFHFSELFISKNKWLDVSSKLHAISVHWLLHVLLHVFFLCTMPPLYFPTCNLPWLCCCVDYYIWWVYSCN